MKILTLIIKWLVKTFAMYFQNWLTISIRFLETKIKAMKIYIIWEWVLMKLWMVDGQLKSHSFSFSSIWTKEKSTQFFGVLKDSILTCNLSIFKCLILAQSLSQIPFWICKFTWTHTLELEGLQGRLKCSLMKKAEVGEHLDLYLVGFWS